VRQHGGTVSIDSDRDSGFAITLYFPGVEASHAFKENSRSAAHPGTANLVDRGEDSGRPVRRKN
jgi:hypothetical protein